MSSNTYILCGIGYMPDYLSGQWRAKNLGGKYMAVLRDQSLHAIIEFSQQVGTSLDFRARFSKFMATGASASQHCEHCRRSG